MVSKPEENVSVEEVDDETTEEDHLNSDSDGNALVTDEERDRKQQEERQKEWGQQFDKWLINAARKEKVVDVLLSVTYPGFTADGNILTGMPKRIDKDWVQFIVNGKEVWISKTFIVCCTPVIATPQLSAA